MGVTRLNRVRIEHRRGKEPQQALSYLATGKWTSVTSNHVMAILTCEWGVETGDRIEVSINGELVDSLDC